MIVDDNNSLDIAGLLWNVVSFLLHLISIINELFNNQLLTSVRFLAFSSAARSSEFLPWVYFVWFLIKKNYKSLRLKTIKKYSICQFAWFLMKNINNLNIIKTNIGLWTGYIFWPAECDLAVQPLALMLPEGCLQILPLHRKHLAPIHPLQILPNPGNRDKITIHIYNCH